MPNYTEGDVIKSQYCYILSIMIKRKKKIVPKLIRPIIWSKICCIYVLSTYMLPIQFSNVM